MAILQVETTQRQPEKLILLQNIYYGSIVKIDTKYYILVNAPNDGDNSLLPLVNLSDGKILKLSKDTKILESNIADSITLNMPSSHVPW